VPLGTDAFERLAEEIAPLTQRGKALLFASIVLVVAGSILGGEQGAAAVAAGIGVALLVLFERVLFTARASVASRLVTRYYIGQPLVEGEEREVVIEVRNEYPVPIEHLEYYDSPPPVMAPPRPPVASLYVPARGSVRISYRVKLVLGTHRWGSARIVVEDPLGLFRKEIVKKTGLVVSVQPKPLGIPRRVYVLPGVAQPGGVTRTRRRGIGVEFLELREYQPGDELRFVDWKSFVRTGRLMVKVFEQESFLRAAVVLDATPTMFRGVVGETKIEYAARLVAALSEYFARQGDNYRVYVVDREANVRYTNWLRGRPSSRYAISFIARSIEWPRDPSEPGVTGDLRADKLSTSLINTLPRGRTLVFLVTDFGERLWTAKRYAARLRPLVGMHNTIYALIPLTTLFELGALKGIAAALYRVLEYRNIKYYAEMVKALKASHVTAIATGPSDLLHYVLAKLEHIRGVTV